MRHATIINTGLQQGVSSYTMFVENRMLPSSSVSIIASVCSICLHPEHVLQNIRLIQLSSAVYLQIHLPCCETWKTETPCQLTLKGAPATEPAAKEQSWRWWFTRQVTYVSSEFERKVDAGCFATIGVRSISEQSQYSKKRQECPGQGFNAEKNKTRKTAHLETCTIDPKQFQAILPSPTGPWSHLWLLSTSAPKSIHGEASCHWCVR